LKIIFKTIPALVVQCLDQRAQKRKARVATATVVAANPEATGASGAMKVAA
jgi:hypothetical protein